MKTFKILLIVLTTYCWTVSSSPPKCVPKTFNPTDSFVCVCDKIHCDQFEETTKTIPGIVTGFESDKLKLRFAKKTYNFVKGGHNSSEGQIITIDRNQTFQSIIGFGGAFTDSTGINILKLGSELSSNIIQDYFSDNGLKYSMGRVPIGGSDFSTHPYTYDDSSELDFNLTNFKLADEDLKYKIPFIKQAIKYSKYKLNLLASPWSPPAWMKSNNKLNGKGGIKGKPDSVYYKTWADYLVRFLDEYKQENISFWGLTIQNEPWDGTLDNFSFNCNAMSPEEQRDFIYQTLGPKLNSSGYDKNVLKLIIVDDQRPLILKWSDVILSHELAKDYVSGIGFHWYLNSLTSVDVLQEVHTKFPEYFLLSTEACEGSNPLEKDKVSLGNWQRAENYAYDIIKDLQYHTNGWIDWNLALDMQGGPNWAENYVDAPIIVNSKTQEYYKQPMYYALAHFTRFLQPGSIRLGITSNDNALDAAVFSTPDQGTVAIVLNRYQSTIPLTITDAKYGSFEASIKGHSIQTFVWFD